MDMEKLEQEALQSWRDYLEGNITNHLQIIKILRAQELIHEDLAYIILAEETQRKRNSRLLQELNKIAHFAKNINHLLSLLNQSGNTKCAAKLEKEVKRRKYLYANKDEIFQEVLKENMNQLCENPLANLKKLVVYLRQKCLLTEDEALSIMDEDTAKDKSRLLFTLVNNKKITKEVLLECLHRSENFQVYALLNEAFESWQDKDANVGHRMKIHNVQMFRVELRENDGFSYVTGLRNHNLHSGLKEDPSDRSISKPLE